VAPPTEIPSLVDDQGFLFDSYEELDANRTPTYEDILREFRAQIERAYQEGLDVAYIDNHVSLNADARRALRAVAREFVLPIKRRNGEIDCDDMYLTPNEEKLGKLAGGFQSRVDRQGNHPPRRVPLSLSPGSEHRRVQGGHGRRYAVQEGRVGLAAAG